MIETSVTYSNANENGKVEKVRTNYIVDSDLFPEVEAKIYEMYHPLPDDFSVKMMKKVKIAEIFGEDKGDKKWFECKVQLITYDEKTEKEKKTVVNIMQLSEDIQHAVVELHKNLGGTMTDFNITSVAQSKVEEIIRD